MNYNDCPNQTDSKCCHQSIKPKGMTMNISDERAWQREFDRVEAKQKQREGWKLKSQPKVYVASVRTAAWTTSHSEQLNEE